MGEPAVILEGVESDEAGAALYSTVHGAGRVMSADARGREVRSERAGVPAARLGAGVSPAR